MQSGMRGLLALLLPQESGSEVGVGGKRFKFWHLVGVDKEGQQWTHDSPLLTH